jgi:hypothetical protein
MKITNETGDWILKAMGIVLSLLTFRWLVKLYSHSDGKKGFSMGDFQKLASFIFFYGGCIWILYAEYTRTTIEHKFDIMWLVFMITGLFSVLHMEDMYDKMIKLGELFIRMKIGQLMKKDNNENQQDNE